MTSRNKHFLFLCERNVNCNSLQWLRSVCMCCTHVARAQGKYLLRYCAPNFHSPLEYSLLAGVLLLTINHLLLSRWSQGTGQAQTAVPMEVVFGDTVQLLPSSLPDHMVGILYHELNNYDEIYHSRPDIREHVLSYSYRSCSEFRLTRIWHPALHRLITSKHAGRGGSVYYK